MDWNAAIERHRTALKRVLATLAALAGLTSPRAEPVEGAGEGSRQGEAEALAVPGGTLPRHVHRAVLRLLRPAEAAARRLVIVAAQQLPALPAHQRSLAGKSGWHRMPAASPRLALPLADPLRRRPTLRASRDMPRISIPGWSEPAPLSIPPTPYDPIDATRLTLRLAALARALDDLPREARRFARWRSRNVSAAQADEARHESKRHGNRVRRTWPLRLGRPPGSPSGRRPVHAVHRILDDINGLAFWALEQPDTS